MYWYQLDILELNMKPRFYLFLARYAFPSLVLWDVLVILMFLWDAPSISGWSVVWLFLLYAILCILLPCAASYLWLRRHHEKCFHLGTMKKQCYLHLEKYSSIGRLLLTGGLFLLPYPTKTALFLLPYCCPYTFPTHVQNGGATDILLEIKKCTLYPIHIQWNTREANRQA